MKKRSIAFISLLLITIVLSGCSNEIRYSEKFEGIPIYPDIEITSSSKYEEHYEVFEFKDTFEDVDDFYMENIDKDKWEIETNHLYPSLDKKIVKSKGYTLKGEEKDVSLIMVLQSTENKGDILYINLNGNPFKEDKYTVEGQSEHWKASLEYIIRKEGIFINGDVIYTGDNPPGKVDSNFAIYEIKLVPDSEENLEGEIVNTRSEGQELKDSRINISSQRNRDYKLEIYEEAIDNGYIEIKWEEDGKDKLEKINLKISK
jgi:hypothetical protein